MLTAYIAILPLFNRISQGFMTNLEKRGIFICFWVLNCDDEALLASQQPGVRGIMSDRPAGIKEYLRL